MLKMWNTWRKFKSKGNAIFVDLFIIYLFWVFYPQKIKAEGHNELWNIFLFSLRQAIHVVLLNTALLVHIFILKAGGQENELFIEVILVYPGNDGFICIYIFVYICIFMTVNKFRHIPFCLMTKIWEMLGIHHCEAGRKAFSWDLLALKISFQTVSEQ